MCLAVLVQHTSVGLIDRQMVKALRFRAARRAVKETPVQYDC